MEKKVLGQSNVSRSDHKCGSFHKTLNVSCTVLHLSPVIQHNSMYNYPSSSTWLVTMFSSIPMPGSNPAVTPGLRTAGVVISSVCLSIVLVTLVCMVAFITYKSCMKKCIMDARDGARRNKQIKKG